MTSDPVVPAASPKKTHDWLVASGLMMGAAAAALAAVYLGTGWQDGFDDWDLHRLGRHFRRIAYWLLPAAALAGPALLAYYRQLLERKPWSLGVLFAIARMFVHFPLQGMLCVLGVACEFGRAALVWLFPRLRGILGALRPVAPDEDPQDALDSMFMRWVRLPFWFMFLPFFLLEVRPEAGWRASWGAGDVPIPSMKGIGRRMLRWLPWMLLAVAIWTGAENDDSGARVNAYLLAFSAAFWLGDYLIVAVMVTPALELEPPKPRDGRLPWWLQAVRDDLGREPALTLACIAAVLVLSTTLAWGSVLVALGKLQRYQNESFAPVQMSEDLDRTVVALLCPLFVAFAACAWYGTIREILRSIARRRSMK